MGGLEGGRWFSWYFLLMVSMTCCIAENNNVSHNQLQLPPLPEGKIVGDVDDTAARAPQQMLCLM